MKKRIVAFINGEGLGHTLDFLGIYPELKRNGYEIPLIIIGETGDDKNSFLKDFPSEILSYPQGKILFEEKKVDWLEVAKNNIDNVMKSRKIINDLRIAVKRAGADIILRFSDACAPFVCSGIHIPQIWIGNQVKLLDKIVFEKHTAHLGGLEKSVQKLFLNVLNTGVSTRFNLEISPHWKDELDLFNTYTFPALIREDLKQNLSPHKQLEFEDFILCYLYQDWQYQEIIDYAQDNPKENVVIFWGKEDHKPLHNVKFFKKNNELYLSYLKKAKAIVSNSGKTTHAESLFLNKPLVAIPLHYEQQIHIEKNPLAVRADSFKEIGKYAKIQKLNDFEHKKIQKAFFRSPSQMVEVIDRIFNSSKGLYRRETSTILGGFALNLFSAQ